MTSTIAPAPHVEFARVIGEMRMLNAGRFVATDDSIN